MPRTVTALAAGLLFGLGLILSGMTDPAKVLGFLDVAAIPAGGWDPSLAFVMAAAVPVAAAGFALARRRGRALCGDALAFPTRQDIDRPLVLGSLLFGAGWGLAGICPGPGLVALAAGAVPAAVFVAAMAAGMGLYGLTGRSGGTGR